jgi:DNA invertase Pin-like site-specific DNA recombinase
MSTLHQTINSLASEFAHSLLRALRGASLDEILAETASGHSAHAGGGRRRGRPAAAAAPAGRKRGGRLHRRTAKQLEHVVAQIVALLKANKKGLRAEEIRTKLHLDRREIPRPLGEALAKKLVTKKGKKRATTYFA